MTCSWPTGGSVRMVISPCSPKPACMPSYASGPDRLWISRLSAPLLCQAPDGHPQSKACPARVVHASRGGPIYVIRWQGRRMVRSSLIGGALLAIAAEALMLGLSLWGRSPKQRIVPVRAPTSVFSSTITTIKGFSLAAQNDDRLLFKVDADELTIQPRSLFVFNIKSIDEIFIKNGVVVLYM